MSKYIKGLDSNHLLTVGLDGFYSTGGKTWANPLGAGGKWENVSDSSKRCIVYERGEQLRNLRGSKCWRSVRSGGAH